MCYDEYRIFEPCMFWLVVSSDNEVYISDDKNILHALLKKK